jgi:hypothetical protein
MFIQYAIEPFQGSEFVVALHPELHSGLFTLNHSVVFLGPGFLTRHKSCGFL